MPPTCVQQACAVTRSVAITSSWMLLYTATIADLSLLFSCGLRGYHEYRAVWTPMLHEVPYTIHERTNPHDRYAIATRKVLPGRISESTVGHLPKEISRATRFVTMHGAIVTVDTNLRRSPLVQGGLDSPVQVTAKMDYSPQNKDAIVKYETLVQQFYKESRWQV